MRLDNKFARSSTLRPVSSQIVFTAPYEKVWISDHHGMLTVLSEAESSEDTKATHDYGAEANPKTEIIQLTSDLFNHPTSPEVSVSGARGVSFTNETGFPGKILLRGEKAQSFCAFTADFAIKLPSISSNLLWKAYSSIRSLITIYP